ncbi:MAG: glycosyltransferase family 4 protein [Tepidisphaeraceae bacterium]
MIRVLAITNNLQQASFRLRVQALIEPLSRRGVELTVAVRPRRFFERRALLGAARTFDAALLQRKLLDPIDIRLLRRNAKRLVFDVDDAVMYHSRPAGPFSAWQTRRRFIATARHVDLVVAGNEYLAGLFRDRGAEAVVLPTGVNPSHYAIKSHIAAESPALVWIGSASTLPYLESAFPALAEAARQVAGLRLIVIADRAPAQSPIPTEHVPWSVETESAALCRGDIGIAPTPCDPWTLGKCGFKIVQYMAAGLPVIASPVGGNAEIVAGGQTGLLPNDYSKWPEAVAALAADVELRKRMGLAGRKRVEENFTNELAADQWARWLAR